MGWQAAKKKPQRPRPRIQGDSCFSGATTAQLAAVNKDDPPRQRQCGDKLLSNAGKVFDSEPERGGDGSRNKGTVGVFLTKEEFTKLATSCIHPLDEEIKVPQRIAQVIFDMARLGPEAIKSQRHQTVE